MVNNAPFAHVIEQFPRALMARSCRMVGSFPDAEGPGQHQGTK